MQYKKWITAAGVATALMATGAGQAAIIINSNTSSIVAYDTFGDFQAVAGNIGVDNFDDLDFGPLGVVNTRQAGSYGYSVASAGGLWGTGNGDNGYLSTSEASDVMLLTGFSSAVRGFGGEFFGSDSSGDPLSGGAIDVTVTDASGTLVVTITGGLSEGFVGFVSTTGLLAVAVQSRTSDRFFPTIDNVTLAAPVPEPGTVAMLLAGLAILPVAARRRRHS